MSSHAARVDRLRAALGRLPDLAVACSGGVDSSVLLHAACEVLGERAVGLLADSPSLPRRDLAEARAFAASIGASLVELRTDELEQAGYRANDGERCYFCRRTLFAAMETWALEHGFTTLAYGEITDDLDDHRPGARAARELGVVSPLREAGLSKADVRRYAREHGLAVAERPASACLSSRLPLGTEVTVERLRRVERAEEHVRALGFRVLRVRDHGARARVEVGEAELPQAREDHARISALLAPQGFRTVELAAYRGPGTS